VRDVRVRAVDVPRSAVPGERIRIAARVVNAGDVAEQLSFACAGSLISSSVDMPRRVLPAGTWSLVEAPVQVRDDAPDGAVVRGAFIVSDANGERASDSVTFRIRDRMTVAPAEPPPAESSPAPSVRTVLHAPRGVFAGAAFETRLELHAGTQIETLRVRIPEVAGCRYVSGSAALDGRALLDRVSGSSDGSPLADDGLVIGGIAAGSRLALAWRLFAQTSTDGDALRVSALIDADGVAHAVESDALEIVEPDSFAVRPDGLAYHVASCAVDPSQTVASGVPADRAIVAPACASEILSASPIDTPAELPPHRGVLPARAGVGQFTLRFDAQRVDDLAPASRATVWCSISSRCASSSPIRLTARTTRWRAH
jgi:hypothetical protein